MQATKRNNLIEIKFDYDPQLVQLIKSFPGREYSPQTKAWYVPIAGNSAVIDELVRWQFNIDPALTAALKQEEAKTQELQDLIMAKEVEFDTKLPLYPFQKKGAAFLAKIGSGLLGDEMGIGKSIQSLAVVEAAGAQQVLIICPAAIKWQWYEEIKKFIGEEAVVVEGTKPKRDKLWQEKARFYVANYELLLRDFDEINRDWDYIIADEATKISNPQTKQSKIIKKLSAKNKIALTGTPINNRAQDVWNIVDFTNPGVFGNYHQFINRYCIKNQWGGIYAYKNIDDLRAKLLRYMIRRTKEEVLPDLPERIQTDVPFKFAEEETKLYKQLKQEILFEINETDLSKINNPATIQMTLVKMTRLRQLADSMELLGDKKTSTKLDTLKELLSEALTNGKKAIVFTEFAEMADILKRELAEYDPLIISGKVKEAYKDIVKQFNEVEKHRILILTSAGQYGLNIQRASVLFHYDQPWSLSKKEQRAGRAHRIGQQSKILEYNLLAKGSIDMYIRKVLHDKARLAGEILGDPKFTMQDLQKMLEFEDLE